MSENLIENLDFYYDENGNVVFTEHYHINKGHCCGHGCRHCPYQFESVPEPKRSQLLQRENA
ncbi:MAG: hypothetical protein CFE25_07575 [Chitinophagaceae bacterium BSSC1]|nr:MAG: hypothetical protein CFE25_07575 [Chitinophagaceae bacterium BSSC1]